MKRRVRRQLIEDLRYKLHQAIEADDFSQVTRLGRYLCSLNDQTLDDLPDNPLPTVCTRLKQRWTVPHSGRRIAPDHAVGSILETDYQDTRYRIVVGTSGLLHKKTAYTSLNHFADCLFGPGKGMPLRYLQRWRLHGSQGRR